MINGLEWHDEDELPATGTYVIRVVHVGGSDEPFALGVLRRRLTRTIRGHGGVPAGTNSGVLGLPSEVRACLFDLDGVLTRTATVHAAAWKEMFDEFLATPSTATEFVRSRPGLRPLRRRPAPPDGTRGFLASRGIHLPEGSPDDPPERPPSTA